MSTSNIVMSPELKSPWVTALRSGEYQQGKRNLCRGAFYCCLGVLCEVMEANRSVFDGNDEVIAFEGYIGHLHPRLAQEAGINDDALNQLMRMNDSQGKRFSEIADWIEANL